MEEEPEPWWRVRGPVSVNGDLTQVLASVDSLQRAWSDVIRDATVEEFGESRRRNLRRHAIETGLIERIYDVDWGVTEALVAEGLSAEVAEREGGIDEGALETIRAQFDALSHLAEAAKEDVPLTVSFIRQLHVALCRTQLSFTAKDTLGRLVQRPLHHGEWKRAANYARTRDGKELSFAPYEQVQSEIENLIEFEATGRHLHPIVRAAWLHHSLVVIHPFEDGNGRVARALTLLVLLQNRYAPLVVDRFSREEYLAALESANDGDLRPLVRLFARLEVVALRAELERPALPAKASSGAVDIARAYVERVQALRARDASSLASAAAELASSANTLVEEQLRQIGHDLTEQFRALDANAAHAVFHAAPPEERAKWWRAQVIRTAQRCGFFANLAEGTWWSNLRLTVVGQQLRYVAVVQKVGRGETGVLALTFFAESVPVRLPEDAEPPVPTQLITPDETDSVTLVAGDDLASRRGEIADVIERTLAAAVMQFTEGLV